MIRILEDIYIGKAVPNTTSGGGGGTTDYNQLSNQPQINNITLVGNKTSEDLSLMPANYKFDYVLDNQEHEANFTWGGKTVFYKYFEWNDSRTVNETKPQVTGVPIGQIIPSNANIVKIEGTIELQWGDPPGLKFIVDILGAPGQAGVSLWIAKDGSSVGYVNLHFVKVPETKIKSYTFSNAKGMIFYTKS